MTTSTHLLHTRRFLPLFVTQLLGAFNDNLFKNAMVLYVVFSLYSSAKAEAHFSGLATALFILPFVTLSALSGQLADLRDKARLIRIIKACEIAIMAVGAAGLLLAWRGVAIETLAIPLMLLALFAMGVHSTFFGPIKYAILPQQLHSDEVLAGTGLVEAGTYLAILGGTILAGWISAPVTAVITVCTAVIGYFAGRQVPPAPPERPDQPLHLPLLRPWLATAHSPLVRIVGFAPMLLADQAVSLYRMVYVTARHPRVFLAIIAISVFWSMGAILFVQFPPVAKDVIGASKEVASLFLVVFSVGIAIGSVSINRLLKGTVSARFAPACALGTSLCIVAFHFVCRAWPAPHGPLLHLAAFIAMPLAPWLLLSLLGVAISGGMFVVPLYAFLTTVVDKSEAARTIAANNIVNAGAMLAGSLVAVGLTSLGVGLVDQLLLSGILCVFSALFGWLLYRAERDHLGEVEHAFSDCDG